MPRGETSAMYSHYIHPKLKRINKIKKQLQKMFDPNNTRPTYIQEGTIIKEEYISTKEISGSYLNILQAKLMTNKQEWFVIKQTLTRGLVSEMIERGTIVRLIYTQNGNTYGRFQINGEDETKELYYNEVSPISLKDTDKKKAIKEIDMNQQLIDQIKLRGAIYINEQDDFCPEDGEEVGDETNSTTIVRCPFCDANLITNGYKIVHTAEVSAVHYGLFSRQERDSEYVYNRRNRQRDIECDCCSACIEKDEYPEILEYLNIT